MSSKLRLVSFFACLLLFASAAHAQEASVFIGGLFPGKATVQNVRQALEHGPLYGVRLSAGFAAFLKLEGTLAFSNQFLLPQDASAATSAKGFVLNGNLLAQVPVGKVIPYATAGLGFIHQYGTGSLPIGTKFAINYGGGLKLPKLFGPLGLRFDARGYTATGVFSHSVNLFEVSGGVMIGF